MAETAERAAVAQWRCWLCEAGKGAGSVLVGALVCRRGAWFPQSRKPSGKWCEAMPARDGMRLREGACVGERGAAAAAARLARRRCIMAGLPWRAVGWLQML